MVMPPEILEGDEIENTDQEGVDIKPDDDEVIIMSQDDETMPDLLARISNRSE